MKLISIIAILIITSCNNEPLIESHKFHSRRHSFTLPPVTTILKKTIDERGLTSVIFKQGKDTFALDYLTKLEFDSLNTK